MNLEEEKLDVFSWQIRLVWKNFLVSANNLHLKGSVQGSFAINLQQGRKKKTLILMLFKLNVEN